MAFKNNENFANLCNGIDGAQGDESIPWLEDNESIFIKLMGEEVNNGNVEHGRFIPETWPKLRDEMEARCGYPYSTMQLRNKYYKFRLLWTKFHELLKEKGVHFDPKTNTLSASNKEWDRLFKVNRNARRFYRRGFPRYQELEHIFAGLERAPRCRASGGGKYACLSSKLSFSTNSCSNSKSGDRSSGSLPKEDEVNLNSVTRDAILDERSSDFHTREEDSLDHKTRKRDSYESSIMGAFNMLAESNGRLMELLELRMPFAPCCGKNDSWLHLKECLVGLNALEDIDGVTYVRAVKMLREDVINRKIFLEIPSHRRRDWILNL